jgi:hypothetical protein
MSTEQQVNQEVVTRDITIFSSQGKNNYKISFTGSHWGELKARLKQEGYNVDSMKCIENIRKSVLEHPKAVLPATNFNLHLYPQKTKGGASRQEVYAKIKAALALDANKAQKFFNGDQNYTRKKTDELEALVAKYEKKNGVIAVGETTPVASEAKAAKISKPSKKKEKTVKGQVKAENNGVADVVESVKTHKVTEATPNDLISESINMLKTIKGHLNQGHIEEAISKLQIAITPKPVKTEEELGLEEHDELMKDLTGIAHY